MALNSDDRLAITEVVAMHGHLFDEGDLDRLDEPFTSDVIYEASDFGQEVMHGVDSIWTGALALGRWPSTDLRRHARRATGRPVRP